MGVTLSEFDASLGTDRKEGSESPVAQAAGTDGVCGLLADGYHYSLDIWG